MDKQFIATYTQEEIIALFAEAFKQPIVKEIISEVIQKELNEVYLKPSEVCKKFQPAISRQTLNRWVKDEIIPKCIIGGATYFKLSEIKNAVKSIQRYKKTTAANSGT